MRKALATLLIVLTALAADSAALAAAELIIDNPNAQMVGSWTTGSSTLTRYGDDYYYCAQSPAGDKTATYLPYIPFQSIAWYVYTWYPAGSNRPTQAQYIVHSSAGESTVYVNQQINGQVWYYLGSYPMQAGTGNWVRITNFGEETSKQVMADAIRFYSLTDSADPDVTRPAISSLGTVSGPTTAVITWTTDEPATSQVEYGETASYGSEMPEQTALVLNHSVTLTGLSFPSTYHFRVRSSDLYGNEAVTEDLTFATSSEIPQTPAFRSAWADGWNPGFRSALQVTTLIDTLNQANYNVVIPEVRKCGDAFYDSAYENRATEITDPLPFDPLADMIGKAHAVDTEVHAWLVTYRIANSSATNAPPVFYDHPEWLTRDSAGAYLNNNFYLLDQGVPGVQDYVCKIVMDVANKYDVDGINLDYIRYQGPTWGYCGITRQRFYDEYGFWPPTESTHPNWGVWCDYRRQQVTDLVKKCYLEVMAVKPHVKMTADTQAYGSILSGFSNTGPYTSTLQDWPTWMEQHILDASIPMNYKDESNAWEAAAYRDWTLFSIDNRYGRHTYIGMSCYKNTVDNSIAQIYSAMGMGTDGISTFSYSSTNNEGLPASDFYDAVRTHLYTSPVPTPDMPWKTAPTTGIIFGTVTDASHPNDPIYGDWVYKATVTATGPVTRSTPTDATGTYGFIDLPPGMYTITCSKPGFPSRTYPNQRIAAGEVLREDFALGYTTITSPPGVVVSGWSLIGLPAEPADPYPAVVFSGIDIDAKLQRWENFNQGLKIYDIWGPDAFGDIALGDGYWLQSDGPGAISYQGLAGNPATHDIHLPTAGWALIGCPFPTERQWSDVVVRHGAGSAPMAAASHTENWLNSMGFWWDAPTQGLMEIGLEEDFVPYQTLEPWHGYWIQTYVDGLTLTIR